MDAPIRVVLFAGAVTFTALFVWMHDLRCRLEGLRAQRLAGA
jgi:hypothetical protein